MGYVGVVVFEKYSLLQADREKNEIELVCGVIFSFLVLCKVVISFIGFNEIVEDN